MRTGVLCFSLALCGFLAGRVVVAPGTVIETLPVRGEESPAPTIPEGRVESSAAANLADLIKQTLSGDDPIASARRAITLIESLTLDDLRASSTSSELLRAQYFNAFQHDSLEGYFDAVAERWLTLDPNALGDMKRACEDIKKKDPASDGDHLLQAAARVNPEAVLTQFSPLEKSSKMRHLAWIALRKLGSNDLRRARAVLAGMNVENDALRSQADGEILEGLAEVDPILAAQLARNSKSGAGLGAALDSAIRIGPGIVRKVVEEAGVRLDYRLPSLLLRYPDLIDLAANAKAPELTPEILRDAEQTSPEDRSRILSGEANLPQGSRDVICAALADAWSREEPAAAAKWALAHSDSMTGNATANLATERVFLRWINSDMDAALAWWKTLPPSPLRDRIGEQASTYVAEDGRFDEALELFPSGSPSNKGATHHLAQILADKEPALAADWMAKLPEASVTSGMLDGLFYEWLRVTPANATTWIESLPPGSLRDSATKSLVANLATNHPQLAADWASTVQDPDLRRKAAENVFSVWMWQDPAAAREWLEKLTGVDVRWKARKLR